MQLSEIRHSLAYLENRLRGLLRGGKADVRVIKPQLTDVFDEVDAVRRGLNKGSEF